MVEMAVMTNRRVKMRNANAFVLCIEKGEIGPIQCIQGATFEGCANDRKAHPEKQENARAVPEI
jgi:hypothetical protein